MLARTVAERHADVEWTVEAGEAVLLRLDSGARYTLNPVATVVWRRFAEDRPLAAILAELRERFDLPRDVVRDDLIALVVWLLDEGLIVVRG